MGVDLDLGQVGYVGQGRRSKVKVNAKNHVFTRLLPCFMAKVKGRSQGQGQRSGSRPNFWRAAVDNRGSALPSAAKSIKSHYQFKVFVCVSVICGCMRINRTYAVDRRFNSLDV